MSEDLVYRLKERARIRRQIFTRKSVQENKPDRIADLLEEAANALVKQSQQLDILELLFEPFTSNPDLKTVSGSYKIFIDENDQLAIGFSVDVDRISNSEITITAA